MNKPIYLGMSVLDISITLMYEFWYGYIKPKYQNNANNANNDIADDVKKWFDTSNYSENDKRPLPRGMNKNVIGLMKEIRLKDCDKICCSKAQNKILTDGDNNVKKVKGTKKCVIRRLRKLNDYKDCLFKNEIILKSQQRFKSEAYNVYTEVINKIALSSNDDKRLPTFDRIITYLYGTNAFKVCDSEMLSKYKWLMLMIIQLKIKKKKT